VKILVLNKIKTRSVLGNTLGILLKLSVCVERDIEKKCCMHLMLLKLMAKIETKCIQVNVLGNV